MSDYIVLSPPTVSEYGTRPADRPIERYLRYGLVVIDKPMGPTSHQVSTWVRDMLELDRSGHIGTLDPRVTGVLPVLLSRSTAVVKPLQGSTKEYVGIMRLHRDVPKDRVLAVAGEFVGEIYQTPPVRSAVKRELRVRTIYSLDIIENRGRDYLFKVRCQGGTYIRTLVRDIGLVLGVGANMQELRRTESSGFRERDCVTLQDLKDAYDEWKETGDESWLRSVVRPVEDAVSGLKKVYVKDTAVNAVCYGAALTIPGISRIDADLTVGDTVAMFTEKEELIGLGEVRLSSGTIKELVDVGEIHGIAVKPTRIVMERDTYPKKWKKRNRGEE